MYATYEKAVSFKKYFNPYFFNVFALEVFAPFPVDPFLNINMHTPPPFPSERFRVIRPYPPVGTETRGRPKRTSNRRPGDPKSEVNRVRPISSPVDVLFGRPKDVF